jgi:hypothetical protein
MTRDEILKRLAAGEKVNPIIRNYYEQIEPKLKNRFKIVPNIVRLWRQMTGATKGQQ